MELINNILSTGIVPALFTDDEKMAIVSACRTKATDAGFAASKDGVWSYFLATCAENLHVVLSMSPAGDALRNRCRNFPGLVGSTSIDWIFPWPEQALCAVAKKFLSDNPSIPVMHKDSIVAHVVHVHKTLEFYSQQFLQILRRNNYVTPKHYLDFINTYLKLLQEKNTFVAGQCNRLAEGIGKIDEAAEQIEQLSVEVEEQRVIVIAAANECEDMLIKIQTCKNYN